jgi:type IV pilus biogenesis protein CpaD/CtpE
MSIRGLVILLLLLAALGLGWQQRQRLQGWMDSAQAAAGPAPSPPVADGAAPKTASKFKSGELRKCVKGQQVSYANVDCPPGHQEQAVTAQVNVVAATPVAKPAAAGSGPSSLHKALDMTRDDTLREKAIERAVDGATR